MVRESVCTMVTTQASSSGCRYWLGICLEGLTAADLDGLFTMMTRWRQLTNRASESPVADRPAADVSGAMNIPLVSVGPSGVCGPYQTEF